MPASLRERFADATERRWAFPLAALATVVVTLYSLLPLKDLVRGWSDFAFVYAAGKTWLAGVVPYDVAAWRGQWVHVHPSFLGATPSEITPPTAPYMYPPHMAFFAVPLGLASWPLACRLWDLVNVVSYAGILFFLLDWLRQSQRFSLRDPGVWLVVAAATLNGAVRWTFFEGQMCMVPLLGVVGAFWAWHQKRDNWVAVFAFLAALKPQIGFLPLAYLCLLGGFRGVLRGALATLLVTALALVHVDLAALPAQLAESYRLHMDIGFNAPGEFFSLSSLLVSLGPLASLTALFGPLLALGFAAGHFRLRQQRATELVSPLWHVAIACALTAAFIPLHGYDLVILTPLVFVAYTLRPGWLGASIVLLVVLASRAPALGDKLGVGTLGPVFTLLLALLTCGAWLRDARGVLRGRADNGAAPAAV